MPPKKSNTQAQSAPPTNPEPAKERKMENIDLGTDFNLDEDVLPKALIPNGNYRGNVTSVTYDAEKMAIVWEVTLADNGGEMNDGVTPIDGSKVWNRNWLPKPGDETTPASNGRGTKRDGKLAMIKQFAQAMQIDMNTPQAIIEGIQNAEWIGKEVIVTLAIEEYQGDFNNTVKKMRAA